MELIVQTTAHYCVFKRWAGCFCRFPDSNFQFTCNYKSAIKIVLKNKMDKNIILKEKVDKDEKYLHCCLFVVTVCF